MRNGVSEVRPLSKMSFSRGYHTVDLPIFHSGFGQWRPEVTVRILIIAKLLPNRVNGNSLLVEFLDNRSRKAELPAEKNTLKVHRRSNRSAVQ